MAAVALFTKQLADLEPAGEEERAKDARLLSNRLVARASKLKAVVAKLQTGAADSRTRQTRLA